MPSRPTKNSIVKCPTYLGPGKFCNREFRLRDGFELDSGKIVCSACAPKRQAKSKSNEMLWYVLACEPGRDVRCRKDLLRKCKDFGCKDVGRVMIPRRFNDGMYAPAGKVLAEGSEKSNMDAFRAGEREAQRLLDLERDSDAWRETLKVTVFMNEKTGRYDWRVRTKEAPVRKVVKVKKYPGYILVQCRYNTVVADIVKRTRSSWGLLLQKLYEDKNLSIKVSESKKGGYRWRVVQTTFKEIVAKGRCDSMALAEERARYAKEQLSTFTPTALKTKEAAEQLIAQKAVNQISKDKSELYKVHVDIRVGDTVRVNDPTWKGVEGKVVSIDKKDKTNPKATLSITVMGATIRITVNVTDCRTI